MLINVGVSHDVEGQLKGGIAKVLILIRDDLDDEEDKLKNS